MQTGQSFSECQGFEWELIGYTGAPSFLNLFELQTFFAFLCTIQRDVINFQHFITPFAIFQSFTDLFRELNDREIENHYKMNSVNVETWHGIIIHPHSICKIVERVAEKTGRTSCTKLENLFRSIRVSDENSSVTRALHFFKLIWTPDFFAFLCTIHSDVINFQHFLTSFVSHPLSCYALG